MAGEWVLGVAGVNSILIGLLLIGKPGAEALAVVWLIGIYALMFGGLLTYLGLKGHKCCNKVNPALRANSRNI